MLKEYIERQWNFKTFVFSNTSQCRQKCQCIDQNANVDKSKDDNSDVTLEQNNEVKHNEYNMKLKNSDVLAHLDQKLGHLTKEQQRDIANLIPSFSDIFPDTQSRANAAFHDIYVGDAKPIQMCNGCWGCGG